MSVAQQEMTLVYVLVLLLIGNLPISKGRFEDQTALSVLSDRICLEWTAEVKCNQSSSLLQILTHLQRW